MPTGTLQEERPVDRQELRRWSAPWALRVTATGFCMEVTLRGIARLLTQGRLADAVPLGAGRFVHPMQAARDLREVIHPQGDNPEAL